MRKPLLNLLLAATLVLISAAPALAQDEPDVPNIPPASYLPLLQNGSGEIEVTAVDAPAEASAAAVAPASVPQAAIVAAGDTVDGVVNPRLAQATGRVRLVIRMSSPSVSQVVAASDVQAADAASAAAVDAAALQQQDLVNWIKANDPNAKTLATLRVAMNAVIMETDAALIKQIAVRPGVSQINPVVNYELDLSETVPYIGAAAAQASGVTGAGVRVAVLDSGVDYTHFNLGGPGTLAAYDAAYGLAPSDPLNTTRDGLFPTAKVVDGWDFVGENWPNTPEAADPDPIDYEGHGTHVSDIIAGKSTDGLHVGVAPDAKLLAIKVCSAIATSCSGLALLQGIEFALDPNGNGHMEDAVDVINMSLGNSYGQKEDDLSFASANAVNAGVVVVASAGNSADRPYIVGSPSSQPEVISVAQTQVPSARTFPLIVDSPANIAGAYKNTETVDWAPIGAGFTGPVAFAGTACAPLPPNSLAGKVALIDRGTCAISLKTEAAANAGAIGVLLGLIADGDAVSFSYGGGSNFVPTLVIIKSYADMIKANIGAPVVVTVNDSAAVALVGSVVGSSSRGPSYSFNAVKPDIGAPGASVSALAGTGNEEGAFGGTSGAAPMVSGSAALILSKYPNASPIEVRARLMNTGETNIQTNPATQPGVLAPITRIGSGEVRVDKALGASILAWDRSNGIPSLSFGYQAITSNGVFCKTIKVTNNSRTDRWLNITPSFRYADDAASGAVSIAAQSKIFVRAGRSESFNVVLRVDGSKLPTWTLNGGALGGDGSLLQSVEFDGYLTIGDSGAKITLPWQIMPRKSAGLVAGASWSAMHNGGGGGGGNGNNTVRVDNRGVENGSADIYQLLGTSPRVDKSELPSAGDNFAMVDLRAVGARYAGNGGMALGDLLEVGITTFGIRSHPVYPAEFDVYLDVNSDGVDDFVAYNTENGAFASTGQTVIRLINLRTGAAATYFYADADLDSANMRMSIPLGPMGATRNSKITMSVYAFDNYFTGYLTDSIENMVFTPAKPKYGPVGTVASVAPGTSFSFVALRLAGGNVTSPSQSGLLLLYRSQAPGFEADIVKVK